MAPTDRLTPIYSVHTDDPVKTEPINEFVIRLAESPKCSVDRDRRSLRTLPGNSPASSVA